MSGETYDFRASRPAADEDTVTVALTIRAKSTTLYNIPRSEARTVVQAFEAVGATCVAYSRLTGEPVDVLALP